MNLSIFVIVPLLMLLGLWLARNDKQVRGVMVAGASVLLGLSIYLVFAFLEARETMPADQAPMLFTYCVPWFEPLHINYSLGVDGISVVMILLTSIIVFTGTFASWQMEPMKKEYFLWFTLLSIGVYGFFISIDMFTMFMFYEVALIPMYLLIGVWGSGAKEYSAMKLTLDVDGWFSPFGYRYPGNLLLQWCSDLRNPRYRSPHQWCSCDSRECAERVLPIALHRFRYPRCAVPIPHMVS